jgi:TetR/AcrR family transcriptional regulator, cholesterol catabolism regulator
MPALPAMAANISTDFSKHDQKLEFILRNAARLYHYCKSKEELLFLIQDNCFGRVLERLEERLLHVDEPLSKLRIFIDNHLSFFAANMAEMKVLSHEAESLAGDLHTHVSTKKDKYTKLATKILKELQQGQREGNRKSQIDLTVATYALFGMMNWIYNWYDPAGKLKVSELVDNVTRLFLRGFVATGFTEEPDFAPKTTREPMSVWRGSL